MRQKKNDILASLTEEELLNAAELRTNRKLRLKPDKVLRHGKGAGEGVSFFFPRQTNGQPPLSPKTKWVEFRFKGKLGNQLKARFKLNEMQLAMIKIHRRLQEEKLQTQMLLQVHDELVFEVPDKELKAARQLIQTEMEQVYSLDIPLLVDIHSGPHWAALK